MPYQSQNITNRPLRVFFCHSSNDKPAALKGDELYQKLRAKAWIQPWLDEEELYPGRIGKKFMIVVGEKIYEPKKDFE